MKRLILFLIISPCAFGQTVNVDILPASTGLNLGHTNQRWNGFFQNVNISGTCTLNGSSCLGSGGTSPFSGGPAGLSFQDVTETSTPSNPASGVERLFANSLTHTFTCITSTGSSCNPTAAAGGSNTQLLFNSSGAQGGITGFTTNGTTTITGGSGSSLDLHSGSSFFLPGSFSTGDLFVTTSTGAVTSVQQNVGEVLSGTGTAAIAVSANPGCLDVRGYYATPYNVAPENEDFGLALKLAIAAAGAAGRKGTFCVDASQAVPSGGWGGNASSNYLYANTNPYLGVTANQGIDIRFPNGPIITSVQWTTPQSGIKWYGSPHTGTLTASSGAELVACNTAGGCGPNAYPQFMPGGKVASICVGTAGACAQPANTALITMASVADCPFTTGQIVMPTANLGTNGQALNGSSLTVLTPGCNGGTSFTASFTATAFTTETNTGYVSATCANGGTNCFPISAQFTTIPTKYNTGTISLNTGCSASLTDLCGIGTTFTAAMVGGIVAYACPSNNCTFPISTSNSPTFARITAFVSATHMTIESNSTTQNSQNYFIMQPNVPVLVCDTCEGKSLNLNAFGHDIDGVSFDMNGILEGVAYLDNQAQERTTLANLQIQLNAQQNRINATAGACAVWGSGYITAGHFNVIGPVECDFATNAGMNGFTGGTTPWHPDGWVIEGYNYIAQSSNAGAEYFNLGTVQGAGSSGGVYDCTWIDGTFGIGVQMSEHCEHFTNDVFHLGQNNATYGNMILNPNANSPVGAGGNADVEFDANAFGNQVWDIMDSWNGCFVKDDVLGTPCIATASNSTFGKRMLTGYAQAQATGGLFLGGGMSLLAGTVEAWLSSSNVIDTGLSRDSAGVIDVGNGTAGNKNGTLNATIHGAVQINDLTNNLEIVGLSNPSASDVDFLTITGGLTTVGVTIGSGSGTDTNVPIIISPKGVSPIIVNVGTAGNPTFQATGATGNTGFTFTSADVCEVGSSVFNGCFRAGLTVGSGLSYNFSSTTNANAGAIDTNISRSAADVVAIGNGTAGDESALLRAGNPCRVVSPITLSTSATTICQWSLPAVAKTWTWSCSGVYSITAGTTPTFGLGMNASQSPTNETGSAHIDSSESPVTATGATATSASSGNQSILTGASVATITNGQFTTFGTLQASATAGLFSITGILGGGTPAGTVNTGTECILQ